MKVDWRMTEEGDLELGSPRYNEFDQLVYVNEAGDLSTDSSDGPLVRDIPYSVSYMSEKQVILNRLRTDNPDWHQHPNIGGDLSELIGLPNTRATGLKGVDLILKSLCSDGFLKENELQIRAIPISPSEILFHITLLRPLKNLVIPLLFQLEHGILTEYTIPE
jgi:hypothetical protein